MDTKQTIRKLAAIVCLDVVGYSRLMERDELGTHTRLGELITRVVQPAVARHSGRIVDTAGDGALIEFPSATGALRCSVEIQELLRIQNDSYPPNQRMDVRIGINLGDVIVDGAQIAGDGV